MSEVTRKKGEDWPALALTMVGQRRLDNIQLCVEAALRNEVPGDLIETRFELFAAKS
jgi:O-methyltransferase